VLDQLPDGEFSYEMDQGCSIVVKITVDRDKREATVDFTGTSEQRGDNFNAPAPVTRAAVLYVFRVLVEADVFTDGHDAVVAELLYKHAEEKSWKSVRMEFRHNDHWAASFRVEKLGRYQYTVRGWSDPFLTWQRDLAKRQAAGQDLTVDLQIGSEIFGDEIDDYETAVKLKAPVPLLANIPTAVDRAAITARL
jgi:hypothetical protein